MNEQIKNDGFLLETARFSPLTPDSTVNKFHNSLQGGKGACLQLGEHLESDFDFYNCFIVLHFQSF